MNDVAKGIERLGQECDIALSLRKMHMLAVNDVRGPIWRDTYSKFSEAYEYLSRKGNPLAGHYKRIQEKLFRAGLSEGISRGEWLRKAESDMQSAGLRVDSVNKLASYS